MLYSKTTNGFYDPAINFNIPEDVVEISAERHKELMQGQASGKIIKSDDKGFPELADKPPLTEEELKKINNDKFRQYLKDTDWYVTRKLETGVEIPEEISEARANARLSILE